MSPREKVLFMKPVLVPLLPADMASAKVYSERLCGNAKWLCPEGLLCTDSVFPDCILCRESAFYSYIICRIGIDTCLDWWFCQGSCL